MDVQVEASFALGSAEKYEGITLIAPYSGHTARTFQNEVAIWAFVNGLLCNPVLSFVARMHHQRLAFAKLALDSSESFGHLKLQYKAKRLVFAGSRDVPTERIIFLGGFTTLERGYGKFDIWAKRTMEYGVPKPACGV